MNRDFFKPDVSCKTHGKITWEDAAFRLGMRADRLVRFMHMKPTAPRPLLDNEIRLIRETLAAIEQAISTYDASP